MTAVTSLRHPPSLRYGATRGYGLAGDKNPAPRSEELARGARIECDGENHERDNAHANCRCEPVEGEAESRDAGQDCRDEEEPGPTFQPLAAQPAAEHNETGKDSDQTDKRVNDGVDGQDIDRFSAEMGAIRGSRIAQWKTSRVSYHHGRIVAQQNCNHPTNIEPGKLALYVDHV